MIALIWSVKKYVSPNSSGTPTTAALVSATTNFQNGTRALPAIRARPGSLELPPTIGDYRQAGD